MTTTAQTAQRHGHPAGDRATGAVFAAQHLIYVLPAVFLFLALRAAAFLQSALVILWVVAALITVLAGRWAGPRLHAVAWAQIPGAFGCRRRGALPWPPRAADVAAAVVKAVIVVAVGWWVASAPSAGAPLLFLSFTAYMAAGLATAAFLGARNQQNNPGRGWNRLRMLDVGGYVSVAVLALLLTASKGIGVALAVAMIAFGLAMGIALAGTRA